MMGFLGRVVIRSPLEGVAPCVAGIGVVAAEGVQPGHGKVREAKTEDNASPRIELKNIQEEIKKLKKEGRQTPLFYTIEKGEPMI